ncbi:MAG: DJ-1 family protein [Candidatus Hydrogenedens sp.]|nr:DJ-1 family protein [Candidatus Hydrogenedens sp.]
MPRVLVPLAEGCEELEAVTIIDILRRAKVEVVAAGLNEGPVTASRGTRLLPDMTLDAALEQDYDMAVLPGGLPGADHLGADARLTDFLKAMADSGKFVGAVCAAPKVLAEQGILKGKRATAYPGFLDDDVYPGVEYTRAAVEVDGKIVTSRGPGTAMDFSLKLVELLCGYETCTQVEAALVR